MKLDQLGPLQREVLDVLWDKGEATVHDVLDALPRKKKSAYTTVLTTLQKLEKAGWATHEERGRAYVYRAKESRAAATGKSIRAFLGSLFQGRSDLLLEHLVNETELDDEELKKLQDLIAKKRRAKL